MSSIRSLGSSNKIRIVLFATVVTCSAIDLHAQRNRTMVLLQLGTDAYAMASGTVNTSVMIRTQGIGVGFSLAYHYAEGEQQYFQVEHERTGVSYFVGRHFKLHGPRAGGPRSIACPAWGTQRRRSGPDPLVDGMHGAFYIHAGYRKERWTYDHTGLPGSIAAGTKYTFLVNNNGVELRAGYAMRWWRLFAEVGMNAFLSFPTTEGRMDPFGDGLYTGARPFRYRLNILPELRAGFQIPLLQP